MSTPSDYRIGLPSRSAALRNFDRASETFDLADTVHSEARSRLLERLQFFNLQPRTVLDLGAATGGGALELAVRYPEARIVALDLSRHMARKARARLADVPANVTLAADAESLPLVDNGIDLVFANLLLPWCDPRLVFAEVARVLRDGGLFLFTSVGPDTLGEVRRAWAAVDDTVHVHGFTDMHDLGDLAARAGLSEPVLDVDRLQVTYGEQRALIEDLRACGATNVAHGRRCQLTGRRRWRAFSDQLIRFRVADRIPISVELIFGQAWGMVAQPRAEDGVVGISVDELARELADRGRRGR